MLNFVAAQLSAVRIYEQVLESLRFRIATVELIGGVEKRPIKVVPYDPGWPQKFAVERAKIVAALWPGAIRVDHIGSTSIPGLAAKPIIDVQLSVKDVDDGDDYLPSPAAAGYQLRVRESAHRMVRTADLAVHVHCCGGETRRVSLIVWRIATSECEPLGMTLGAI